MTKTCRFCLRKGKKGWLAPCDCKGSVKWVHKRCLQKWRESDANLNPDVCPTCRQRYNHLPHPPRRPRLSAADYCEHCGVFVAVFFILLLGYGIDVATYRFAYNNGFHELRPGAYCNDGGIMYKWDSKYIIDCWTFERAMHDVRVTSNPLTPLQPVPTFDDLPGQGQSLEHYIGECSTGNYEFFPVIRPDSCGVQGRGVRVFCGMQLVAIVCFGNK